MASNKKLVLIAVVLLIIVGLLAGYYWFLYSMGAASSTVEQTFKLTALTSKPTLLGQYIKNPDILYSSIGWISPIPENIAITPIVLNGSSDWGGNGFVTHSITPLGNRTGIAIIHPINTSVGRYIEQSTSLPSGSNYVLYLGVADIADMLQANGEGGGFSGNCADAGIKVIITDNSKNQAYTVFDQIIRNGKWYDYSVDLGSTFSGDNITLRVQSYAADSGCGLWNGEYAAVDYADIAAK